jgi:hypothetical protein
MADLRGKKRLETFLAAEFSVAERQHGYCHGDKVFRPAKVIVNDLSYSPGVRHAR